MKYYLIHLLYTDGDYIVEEFSTIESLNIWVEVNELHKDEYSIIKGKQIK